MISLQNALEPSSSAPAAPGPKHAIPAAASASATPATSGASGPTTTSETPSAQAAATTDAPSSTETPEMIRASAAIPAFPGAHSSSGAWGERRSAWMIACSRAPPPRTRTRRRSAGAELTSDGANEIVDRDRAQRLVLSGPARPELERYARDDLLVRRLDDVD